MPISNNTLDFDEQLFQNYLYGIRPEVVDDTERPATSKRLRQGSAIDAGHAVETCLPSKRICAPNFSAAFVPTAAAQKVPRSRAFLNFPLLKDLEQAALSLRQRFAAADAHPVLQERLTDLARTAATPAYDTLCAATQLTVPLNSYQHDGVLFLRVCQQHKMGAFLDDESKTDKILQTLAVLPTNALVIAPTVGLNRWAQETKRLRPDLDVAEYSATACMQKRNVLLMSYDQVRRELGTLKMRLFDMVVFDEAQKITNPQSNWYWTAKNITADFRLATSSISLQNKKQQLDTLLLLSNPDLYAAFKQVAGPIPDSARTERHLQTLLDVVTLRRNKLQFIINVLE